MLSLELTTRQSFCSFLGVIGPSIEASSARFDRILHNLPRYREDGQKYAIDQFKLIIFPPNNNPLHRWYLIHERDRIFFLQGDFYRVVPEQAMFEVIQQNGVDKAKLHAFLNSLNGTFNGFVVDTVRNTCITFTDQFGFNFLYYAQEANTTWISSSIWPLLRLDPDCVQVRDESMQDIILFGHPIANHTILSNVFTNQPGRTVCIEPSHVSVEEYVPLPTHRSIDVPQALDRFRTATREHFDYVSKHVAKDRFVTTLTGGRDTRTILNAMLDNNITPTCLTGMSPTIDVRDWQRGARVARHAGCPFYLIDYTKASSEFDRESFFMSEGGGTGLWMANIGVEGQKYGDVIYYGYISGVLGAYDADHIIRSYKGLDGLVFESFVHNYEYLEDPRSFCADLLHVQFDDVLLRYAETFREYAGLHFYDQYTKQKLANRNARRIAYFANASKLGATTIDLCQDRDIAETFYDLPFELFINQKFQCTVAWYACPSLAWIPANQWYVPLWMEPMFLEFVRSNGQSAKECVKRIQYQRRQGTARKDEVLQSIESRYSDVLAQQENVGLLDLDAVKRALVNESYSGKADLLALRLRVIAKMVQFARGQSIGEEGLRLFPKIQHVTGACL